MIIKFGPHSIIFCVLFVTLFAFHQFIDKKLANMCAFLYISRIHDVSKNQPAVLGANKHIFDCHQSGRTELIWAKASSPLWRLAFGLGKNTPVKHRHGIDGRNERRQKTQNLV